MKVGDKVMIIPKPSNLQSYRYQTQNEYNNEVFEILDIAGGDVARLGINGEFKLHAWIERLTVVEAAKFIPLKRVKGKELFGV